MFKTDGVAKVRCFGSKEALDAVTAAAGTLVGRIAPDELIVVGDVGTADALVANLRGQLDGEGTAALVVDHSDGWSFFTVLGDGLDEIVARITMIDLPRSSGEPVFVAGRICDVAAKAFVRPARLDIMCGSEATLHVAHRLEHAGHHLGLHPSSAPANDPIGVSA